MDSTLSNRTLVGKLTLSAKNGSVAENDTVNFWFVAIDKCTPRYGRAYCGYASLIILLGFVLQMLVLPLIISRIRALGVRFRNQYNLSFLWLCSIALTVYVDLFEYMLSYDGHVQSKAIALVNCVYFVLAVWVAFEFWRYYDAEGMNNSWQYFLITLFSLCLAVLIGIFRVWSYKHAESLTSSKTVVDKTVKSYTFLYLIVYAIFGFAQIHSNIRSNFSRCFTQSGYSLWIIGSYMLTYYTVILDKQPKYDYIYYKNYFQITTVIYIVLQEVISKQVKARNQKVLQRVYQETNIPMKEQNSRLQRVESVDAEIQMTEPSDRNSSQYESFRFSDSGTKLPPLPMSAGRSATIPPIPSDRDGVDVCFDAQQYERGTAQNNLNVYDYDQNEFSSHRALHYNANGSSRLERFEGFLTRNANMLLCIFIGILTFQLFFSSFVLLRSVSSGFLALLSITVHPMAFLVGYSFKNYSFAFLK